MHKNAMTIPASARPMPCKFSIKDLSMRWHASQSAMSCRFLIKALGHSIKPLFEFIPESDKLNVELPKIILGNESYLKLE